MERLLEAERRNLAHYGFGVKGCVLSMIETAIGVTDARVPAAPVATLLEAGYEMLRHPVDLLPGAEKTVRMLAPTHTLIPITMGDLLDQERKLAESGLWQLFDGIEMISEKTARTHVSTFDRHGDGPARAPMVGNSMRSGVLPALEAVAWGVFRPSGIAWAPETAEGPEAAPSYRRIDTLAALPGPIATLD